MDMQEYLRNRLAFPLEELAKHRGEWVAWSPDGTPLVPATRNPDALDDLVRAAGENPEDCPIEGIPETSCVVGGLKCTRQHQEVAMSEKADFRIDVEAAKALIYWKSLFADEVAARARQLAAESSQPEHVTLSHYRQAAQIALPSLAAVLHGGPSSDDHQAA